MAQKKIALALATGMTMALSLGAAPAAQAAPSKTEARAEKIHKLTNKTRSSKGLKQLKAQKCLKRYALKQAKAQAAQERMFHQELSPVLKKCKLSMVGENVAYGYTSASSVHRAWMNSTGHRANILQKKYRLVGVGVAKSKRGEYYYAVVFGRG